MRPQGNNRQSVPFHFWPRKGPPFCALRNLDRLRSHQKPIRTATLFCTRFRGVTAAIDNHNRSTRVSVISAAHLVIRQDTFGLPLALLSQVRGRPEQQRPSCVGAIHFRRTNATNRDEPQQRLPTPVLLDDWYTLFGTGSQPASDPDNYPPPAEVLDAMRERRGVLIELLKGLSDEELQEQRRRRSPTGVPTLVPSSRGPFGTRRCTRGRSP